MSRSRRSSSRGRAWRQRRIALAASSSAWAGGSSAICTATASPIYRSRAACATRLIANGRARPHHVLPESGWITVSIRSPEEAERAIELFRMAYERAQNARRSGA